jgi:hypothetical protein
MIRTATIVITREGRDKGGQFTIMEKPAYQATEWFLRAAQLMARAGVDLPPNILMHGVEGFATMGIGAIVTGLGKAPWHEVKPLLDDLLSCIQSYQPPGAMAPLTGPMILQQIAEPATILQMHEEVVSLHLGFSLAVRFSEYLTMGRAWIATIVAESGQNTATSIQASESSSLPN